MVSRSLSRFVFAGLVAAALSTQGYAEERRDHQAAEQEPQASSQPQGSGRNTTRRDVLVDGFREARLSPAALRTLDNVFRKNPRISSGDFNRILDRISSQQKGLLTPNQVDDLKRLYGEALSGVNGEVGKELSDAARAALKEGTANGELVQNNPASKESAKATGDAKGGEKQFNAPADKGKGLSPEALDTVIKALSNKDGKAPEQNAKEDSNEGGLENQLLQQAALAKFKDLFGKDKDGDRRGSDRGFEPNRPQPPTPPPGFRGARGDDDRDRKKDDHNKFADKGREGRNSPVNVSVPSSGERDSKEKEQPKQASSGDFSSSKKKQPEPEPPKPEKKEDPQLASNPNDLLNSLKGSTPPPKKSPLPPLPVDAVAAAAGLFGGSATNSLGAGAAVGGMSFQPPIISANPPTSAVNTGDPFPNLGNEMGGGAYGTPGGGAFSIAKDGGYGTGGGGSYDSGDSDSDLGAEDYSPPAAPIRNAYFEQISRSPSDSGGTFILKEYMGFARNKLCQPEENRKRIGICQGLEERQRRKSWWRRMESDHASPDTNG